MSSSASSTFIFTIGLGQFFYHGSRV